MLRTGCREEITCWRDVSTTIYSGLEIAYLLALVLRLLRLRRRTRFFLHLALIFNELVTEEWKLVSNGLHKAEYGNSGAAQKLRRGGGALTFWLKFEVEMMSEGGNGSFPREGLKLWARLAYRRR